jgi:UDP-N-acetylmuramoylalanine--D-glutamate ligase
VTETSDYSGMRVTVFGLGVEGLDLVRFFSSQGAWVTVSDAKPAEMLGPALAAVADLELVLSLGGNSADAVESADLVAVAQGVPLDLPPIVRARERGIPVTSRTELFFDLCQGTIVGISGSSGKTTTTSLVGAIIGASGRDCVVGGNIGGPLLSRLPEINETTWVVLEISHTQLQLADRSPHIACLTNVTPNHLDRFSWDEYVALKHRLIAHQAANDLAILNFDDPITRDWTEGAAAEVLTFSTTSSVPADGAFLRGQQVIARRHGNETAVLPTADIPLRGAHNVENVLAAIAVAAACEVPMQIAADAVRHFHAPPHRLEVVDSVAGVTYINDSIATTPERTLAGLRSFEQPIVLLLGGRDKHLPLEELAQESSRRCRAVVCFGEAADLLAAACRSAHPHGLCAPVIRNSRTLSDAVGFAAALAQEGDVVLLSPACTSFDAYDNFEQRGAEFRTLVRGLASSASATTGHKEVPPSRPD